MQVGINAFNRTRKKKNVNKMLQNGVLVSRPAKRKKFKKRKTF